MGNNFWRTVDAYVFRLFGVVVGFFGCYSLVQNNDASELFVNSYGVSFLIIFALLGFYSTFSIVKDIIRPGRQ
ncbi:MAG: hypothetical protein HY751_06815 [Nitrospinae bacterium]|nr:hypothetical protein [Nitrospinota bacterium]